MLKKSFVMLMTIISISLSNSLNAQELFIPAILGNSINNNIGIGLNAPQSRLHILSSGTSGILQLNFIKRIAPQGPGFELEEPGSPGFLKPDFGFKIFNDDLTTGFSYTSFLIRGNGSTEIGDFSRIQSKAKLNVRNDFALYYKQDQFLKLVYKERNNGASFIWNNAQNGDADNLSFRFGMDDSAPSLLSLSPTGQLGLGTTNFVGNHKLFIGGTIIAEELTAKLEHNWPDYVFSPDYNMISNLDLAKFIKENGHLPGIPTAAEISKTGIEIAKTEILLLEKIEELTLRLLELDQQVRMLEELLGTED